MPNSIIINLETTIIFPYRRTVTQYSSFTVSVCVVHFDSVVWNLNKSKDEPVSVVLQLGMTCEQLSANCRHSRNWNSKCCANCSSNSPRSTRDSFPRVIPVSSPGSSLTRLMPTRSEWYYSVLFFKAIKNFRFFTCFFDLSLDMVSSWYT